jgi:N-acetylglucosamine-6-phosphate deacetylase
MTPKAVKIINGRIITPDRIIDGGNILVTGAIITAVNEPNPADADIPEIDAKGMYVSPGFIDLHVHGGGGFDFMDGHETAFLTIAETHARYGTTAMLPTTLTSSKQDLLHTLDTYSQAHAINTKGAQFLGMHLEGPYFAMNQRGAQDARYIRDPDPAEYTEILDYASRQTAHLSSPMIKRWSAAPELKGAIDFARFARQIRYAGVIEAAFLIDEMDVEIIADGIHLPAPLLRLVYKIKGPDKTALITDAMRAAGMPPGESILGNIHSGLKVIVEDGVAKLPDRSAFAGSVATSDRLVRNMIKLAGVPLLQAVKMITQTPAAILGLHHSKGALEPGKDADLLIFDDDIQIQMTMIGGHIVYEKR